MKGLRLGILRVSYGCLGTIRPIDPFQAMFTCFRVLKFWCDVEGEGILFLVETRDTRVEAVEIPQYGAAFNRTGLNSYGLVELLKEGGDTNGQT